MDLHKCHHDLEQHKNTKTELSSMAMLQSPTPASQSPT